MRVEELLSEEVINAGEEAKAMSLEFKELANRFKLSLIAGMGWPQVVKDGVWMGGGMGPLRGIDDGKVGVSIEKRRLAFIAAVAKKLEDYLAEGRVVKLAKGGQRSRWTEPAVAGKVKEQMLALIVEEQPPGTDSARVKKLPTIVWFVGLKPGAVSTTLMSVNLSISGSTGAGRTTTIRGEEVWYPPWQFMSFFGTMEFRPEQDDLLSGVKKMAKLASNNPVLRLQMARDMLMVAKSAFGVDENSRELGMVRIPSVVRNGTVELQDFLDEAVRYIKANPETNGVSSTVKFDRRKVYGRGESGVKIEPFIPIIRKYANA